MNEHDQFIYDRRVDEAVRQWLEKSTSNVAKWGLQDVGTMLLATQEELAEVVEEADPHLQPSEFGLKAGLKEIERLGFNIRDVHENIYEDEDGNPVDDPPSFEFDPYEDDLDRIEDELADTAALLIQIQAAIVRAREQ
ncbi:hypothetical protein [Natrinema sp. DC36]|uniref:hypothetical protein n=1 Tax=Natrinema sp. DC36 TaxID=2878680 RepID=UPI001CEFD553|nr:hypothetical protein [Natrinema sp. DC36]